jgi:hypothetical protein
MLESEARAAQVQSKESLVLQAPCDCKEIAMEKALKKADMFVKDQSDSTCVSKRTIKDLFLCVDVPCVNEWTEMYPLIRSFLVLTEPSNWCSCMLGQVHQRVCLLRAGGFLGTLEWCGGIIPTKVICAKDPLMEEVQTLSMAVKPLSDEGILSYNPD